MPVERVVPPELPEQGSVQPPTPEEALKRRLDALKNESDDARTARRAAELKQHVDVHMENIASSNAMYPVPSDVPYKSLSENEQGNWNKRRADIDQANRAYHLAVKRTVASHAQEEQHLAKLRSEAATTTA